MAGIYIHIPFCKQRCRYCAFYSTTLNPLQERYTDAVCKELKLRHLYIKGEKVETIYFGGGTPSMLDGKLLKQIMDCIKENYALSQEIEATIECNPDDLSPQYLAMLKATGFNRISMGVQSFSEEQLQRLGRRHTADAARQAVRNARAAGFDNISIDLMYALPCSTREQWASDLESAIELHPEHISAYNLTYEEGTPLHRALKTGKIKELSEEENIEQFNMLIDKLKAAGYNHYEISNFALDNRESRHNSSYWNDTPYIGCGAAAHSYNGTSRGWNIANIKAYIKGIEENTPVFETEELSIGERYNDTILTRLRTSRGLPLAWTKEKFGNTLYNYMLSAAQKYIASGHLQEKDGHIALTEKGIFISDAVIRELIYV